MGLLHFETETFRDGYNKKPFLVRHDLAEHPLMQLPKLTELALRRDPKLVIHRVGKVPHNTNFDKAHLNHPLGNSLKDALANVGAAGVAITINLPETDPEYKLLIDRILAEIRVHSEPIDPGMNWSAAYIFIAAPGSLTPYHMDREMNFLLHVRGPKTVQLWDPNDPVVMSDVEIDRLFGDWTQRPQYKPEAEAKAMTYKLDPGLGVHHPFIAPHLVKTGDGLAISLAVTFRTRGSDRTTELHKINYKLRLLGMKPPRVGLRPGLDAVKYATFGTVMGVSRALRGKTAG